MHKVCTRRETNTKNERRCQKIGTPKKKDARNTRNKSKIHKHQEPPTTDVDLKNTPALRARGLHTRSRWSSVISKRNQTKTFELMAFFWHGNSASVRFQNPPKASKTLQKPSKDLERDPTLDRFLQTAQISLKRCRFPYISLKRLKLLMISLNCWWFP